MVLILWSVHSLPFLIHPYVHNPFPTAADPSHCSHPKSCNCSILANSLRSIAHSFFSLKLTEQSALRRLTCFVSLPAGTFSFCKPKKSTLDVVAFLVWHTAKYLDASAESVKSSFLIFWYAIGSVLPSLLFPKLEEFSYPWYIVSWLPE